METVELMGVGIAARDAEAKAICVFLEGAEVTNDCFYAVVPIEPNLEAPGMVSLYKVNAEGRRYLVPPPTSKPFDGGLPAQEHFVGMVRWEYREC